MKHSSGEALRRQTEVVLIFDNTAHNKVPSHWSGSPQTFRNDCCCCSGPFLRSRTPPATGWLQGDRTSHTHTLIQRIQVQIWGSGESRTFNYPLIDVLTRSIRGGQVSVSRNMQYRTVSVCTVIQQILNKAECWVHCVFLDLYYYFINFININETKY